MDPNLFKLTEVRHNERLQAGAEEKHYKTRGVSGPSLPRQVLSSLGNVLVTVGQKMKAQDHPYSTPAFSEK